MLKGVGAAGVVGLLPVFELVASAQLLDGRKGIGMDEVKSAQETATHLAIAYRANPGADSVRAAKAHAYTARPRPHRGTPTGASHGFRNSLHAKKAAAH